MDRRSDFQHDLTFEDLEELVYLMKQLYGYDFSQYSRASFKRRISRLLLKKKVSFYDLKQLIINAKGFADEIVSEITVNVTEMFRDPDFFRSFRYDVVPYLKSFQHIKLWNAGCATGEESYSFAILLEEEGLYRKSFIYGTDLSQTALEKARKGIYSLREMKAYSENFLKTGTTHSLANYYTVAYDAAAIQQTVKKNILFAAHNLVSDGVFNEFQVVICRNVMIYFEETLQQKVLELLYESICPFGFLCLGSKEAIRSASLKNKLKVINQKENIYQKIA